MRFDSPNRTMPRSAAHTLAILALVALTAVPALGSPRPPKPYRAVAITPPPAFDDESFMAFRKQLAAVAQGRVYAELARLTATQDFFWGRDFSGGFDARKPAVDNLAAALRLERHGGAGWIALAAFAAGASAAPLPSYPGVVCTPRQPQFDEVEFDLLLQESNTDQADWAYPGAVKLDMRSAARSDAAVIATLGLHFVRVLEREVPETPGPRSEPVPSRQWAHVVAPGGRTGFVDAALLRPLAPERLCYGKDSHGQWRIMGFIGRGD
jgi:hypothetical protein